MNILLVLTLAVIQVTHGYQWNTHHGVQDTPEVAHAKAEHFAAVAKAKTQVSHSGASLWTPTNTWSVPHYAPEIKYHGPIAVAPGYDKHGAPLPVLDTPEVAHARAAHLAEVAKAGGHIYPSTGPDLWTPTAEENEGAWEQHGLEAPQQKYAPISTGNKYHGPIAYSPGYDKHGAPLPVLETPEVSHATALHFAAYAKAAAANSILGGNAGGHKWKRSIHEAAVAAGKHAHFAAVEKAKAEIALAAHHHQQLQGHNSWAYAHYAPTIKYHGPIALPPGYDKHGAPLPVLDTPEVAHARAAHLAEVAKAGGHIYPSVHHHYPYYAGHHSEHESSWAVPHYASAHIRYHGPIALPPGYDKHGAPLPVLDTPEVAAGKAHHHAAYAKIAAEHAAHHHHDHHYW